jgi:hypothetical protein
MQSIPEIIEKLGGATALADHLSKAPTTVASWKDRASIPIEYWPKLLEVASEKGVALDYEQLVRLHTASVD